MHTCARLEYGRGKAFIDTRVVSMKNSTKSQDERAISAAQARSANSSARAGRRYRFATHNALRDNVEPVSRHASQSRTCQPKMIEMIGFARRGPPTTLPRHEGFLASSRLRGQFSFYLLSLMRWSSPLRRLGSSAFSACNAELKAAAYTRIKHAAIKLELR